MDPITLVVGGCLIAVGYAAGALIHRRRSGPAQLPTPTCGCGHGLDKHDPSDERCHAQVVRSLWKHGRWAGQEFVTCPCRQYTGPRPVEELFAPRYLPPRE